MVPKAKTSPLLESTGCSHNYPMLIARLLGHLSSYCLPQGGPSLRLPLGNIIFSETPRKRKDPGLPITTSQIQLCWGDCSVYKFNVDSKGSHWNQAFQQIYILCLLSMGPSLGTWNMSVNKIQQEPLLCKAYIIM